MRILTEEALNGTAPNPKQRFILNYLSIVVLFHQTEDRRLKDRSYAQIHKGANEGHRLGFNEEELNSLNFIVLEEKEGGRLKFLEQKLKEKGVK